MSDLVEILMKKAFGTGRSPRSAPYKEGVRALLTFKATGARGTCPYKEGTSEADAFWAGCEEGHLIWHESQRERGEICECGVPKKIPKEFHNQHCRIKRDFRE